jgi:hypothetical protein
MKRSDDILNELNELSPLLAGIDCKNVFSVPEGYFNTVADTVLVCVNAVAPSNHTESDVPAGYFDTLASNILGKINGTVANELSEIAPFLAGIKKENPFKVPKNYFEQLPSDVVAIMQEEKIPVVLQDAKALQSFTVPQGYFENLSADILSKVKNDSGAKVITMPKRMNLLVKYAVAAAIIGAVALGVYKFTNNTSIISGSENLVKIDSVITKGMTIAADTQKFDETLGNLDEEAISKYLEQNASESDMALLSSGIDEGTLPTQEDYLTDEKTLDNFIEEISSKN